MRPRTLAAIAGLCSVCLAGCEVAPEPTRGEPDAASQGSTPPESSSPSGVTSLIDRAVETHYRGQYDSARALLSSALGTAQAQRDTAAIARSITWLGLGHWRQGQYSEARRLGEEALELQLAAGLTDQVFRSYNALGLVAWDEARLEEAGRLFTASLDAATQVGNELAAASAAGNLGLIHTDLGNFASARKGFDRMRDAGRALDDARREANALTNLGMLDVRIGDPLGAIPHLREALRLQRSIGQVAGIENALGQLGTAYAAIGDMGTAYAMYDSALTIAREQGLRDAEAQDLEVMAELHRDVGDFRRALRLFAAAREINEELGATYQIAQDLRSEAEIYLDLGNLGLARTNGEKALRIHEDLEAGAQVLKDLVLLSDVALASGEPTEAQHFLARGAPIAERLEIATAKVDLALAQARVAAAGDEYKDVLDILEDAGPIFERVGYASQAAAASLRTRAYTRLGRFAEAVSEGRRSVKAIERVRGTISSGLLRSRFVASKSRAFTELTYTLLRTGQLTEAFEVADAARAQSLKEHLGAAGASARASNATIATMVEGEEILRRVASLVETASDPFYASDPSTREALQRRLIQAREEYEEVLVRVPETDARLAGLLGQRMEAATIRGVLQPDEVLLEYLITPEGVVTFVVTRDEILVAQASITPENLTNRVRLARERLGSGAHSTMSPEVLEGLYEILIAPAERLGALQGVRSLIIVPHGVLSYLPFSALRDPVTQRFLVEDVFLLHLPSAAALPLLRASSRGLRSPRDRSRSSHVFAPFPKELPGTRREAESTRKVLAGIKEWIGADATEGALRSALEDGGIVHVATHGIMNTYNPLFSRIMLQNGPSGVTQDDGRLEVHELLSMRIRAPLVFLSGCETGLGPAWSTQFSAGEDYATLSQAFLFAGAQNVIATLWPIEDDGASVFVDHFYRALGTHSELESLAIAQRQMIDSSEFNSPYYWASYRLSGAGTHIGRDTNADQ